MEANAGRNKAHTQDVILTAATELFVAKGYERTTVRDIADRAGVSRATVFWHFNDKVSVFREAFSRMLAPFRASLNRQWDDLDPSKRLDEQLAISQRFAEDHGHEIMAFVRWALESTQLRGIVVDTLLDLNQRFADALTDTVSQLIPEDRDPKLLAHGLMLAFDGMLFLGFFDERPRSYENRTASVHALISMIKRDAMRG